MYFCAKYFAMSFFVLLFVAFGLAMDCFAVSLSCSIANPNINKTLIVKVALAFAVFQAGMPIIGWLLGSTFKQYMEQYDHWVSFAILSVIGIKMIGEALKKKPGDQCFDFSNNFVLFSLAVATSIDAFIVGVSFAFLEVNIWQAVFAIGIVTFVLTLFGIRIGKKFGLYVSSKWAEIFGGLVLIFLGLKILIQHLFYT